MAAEPLDPTTSALTPIPESEMNVSNSGPAVLSNRIFAATGQWGLRITFAEQDSPQKPPAFRTAVVMSFQDGIALYKMLQGLLKEPEAALQKSTEEAQAAQKSV